MGTATTVPTVTILGLGRGPVQGVSAAQGWIYKMYKNGVHTQLLRGTRQVMDMAVELN